MKGREEGKRKPQEKVSGWKEVRRKAKERRRHRETIEKQRVRAEEDRICIIREERACDAKKNVRRDTVAAARGSYFCDRLRFF